MITELELLSLCVGPNQDHISVGKCIGLGIINGINHTIKNITHDSNLHFNSVDNLYCLGKYLYA